MTADLQFHSLADLFPLLEGYELAGLVDDIRANGLREPIVLFDGKILDGRNRHRACMMAGVAPLYEEYEGDDPVAYVVSLNLRRRHLDESQRAMVAAKLATLKRGDNQHSPIGETSQARAAELLNVGKRSVERAHEVQDHGVLELRQAVERGEVSVSAAADIATQPIDEQREIVARGEKEILDAARKIRAARAEQSHADRIKRLAKIAEGNRDLPDRQYPIVLADPPWHFEVYDETSGLAHAAGNHYPTMSTEAICALPISKLASDAAVLFLWTTSPHLPESFRVIEAWGFNYKTSIVWVKDRAGLGYWIRNQHEFLLLAARGDIPTPLPAAKPPSVIHAARREHSRKPDEAYALIERMYPDLPKIELFARSQRPGWAVWGNEAPAASYDANDDFAKSYDECLRAIRERKASGGPGWIPKRAREP
jgi:N6-adenosine-specific RNA methylase IME4